jgi:hypothetical protein
MPAPISIYTALSRIFAQHVAEVYAADEAVAEAREAVEQAQQAAVAALIIHRQASALGGAGLAMAESAYAHAQQHERVTQAHYQAALVHAIAAHRAFAAQLPQAYAGVPTGVAE